MAPYRRSSLTLMLIGFALFASATYFSLPVLEFFVPEVAPSIALFHVPFDSKAWHEWTLGSERPSIRQRMIKDLVTNVLPGLTRREVAGLLGQQPIPGNHAVDSSSQRPELSFLIGMALPPGASDTESLVLHFDSNDIFEGWSVFGEDSGWPKLVGSPGNETYK